MSSNTDKYWLAITIILVLSLISGGITLAIKLHNHRPLEITLTQNTIPQTNAEIYIDGAVVNPGYYPLRENDSIDALIHCAGLRPDADLQQIKLYISPEQNVQTPQRISLNRADAWLLEALPGIGTSTLDNIREFITVEE